MNIKYLKVVLISVFMSASISVFAETLSDADKAIKASKIEREVNQVFTRALSAAATKLEEERQMTPFAIILKNDDSVGYFEIDPVEAGKVSVNKQVFQIRRMLTEMALAGEIKSSVIALYVSIAHEEQVKQGITFEVEHIDGVALLRMVPVTEKLNGDDPSTIVLHTESITTSVKHANVFTDMAKSISQKR